MTLGGFQTEVIKVKFSSFYSSFALRYIYTIVVYPLGEHTEALFVIVRIYNNADSHRLPFNQLHQSLQLLVRLCSRKLQCRNFASELLEHQVTVFTILLYFL